MVKTRAGEEFAASASLLASIALESEAMRMQRATLYGADEIVANPPPFTELQLSLVRALGKPWIVR
ncbi:MAG: hypothetical protein HC869_13065 [Rhodospirillales bacterium]|nr:hypothetical protein [Rhodospirillales bacterium]